MSQGDQARYRIGDQMFNDLPALLNFYKVINKSNEKNRVLIIINDVFSKKVIINFFVYLGSLLRHDSIDSTCPEKNRKSSGEIRL